MKQKTIKHNRIQRHARIRAKIKGTSLRPRLFVFRSNKHFYVQLIDDEQGKVLAAFCDTAVKTRGKKEEGVKEIAKQLVQKAKEGNIEKVVFDRGGYKYHGRVKRLAEEMRAQGIVL